MLLAGPAVYGVCCSILDTQLTLADRVTTPRSSTICTISCVPSSEVVVTTAHLATCLGTGVGGGLVCVLHDVTAPLSPLLLGSGSPYSW